MGTKRENRRLRDLEHALGALLGVLDANLHIQMALHEFQNVTLAVEAAREVLAGPPATVDKPEA